MAFLRVLEKPTEPLQLLAVERGGQVVRFARGERSFRFDVQTGTLTAGTSKSPAGKTRLQARSNMWVSAAADGSILWHSALTPPGGFQLALYPAADGERWVLFTPSGYFDHDSSALSRKGDWLVGWEVPGDGPSSVARYPLWHFSPYYHRPDVVRRVLSYEDGEVSALREANLSLPEAPVVPELRRLWPPRLIVNRATTIVSERWLPIEVALRSPSGEAVLGLEARVQDMRTRVEEVRAVAGDAADARTRGISLEGTPASDWQHKTYRVRIPAESGKVTLWARTRFTQGEPITLRFTWQGRDRGLQPRLDGLVVGVGQYRQKVRALPQAPKDAADLKVVLGRQVGQRYRDVALTSLINGEATKRRILAELDRLAGQSRDPEDVVVLFFAGHGTGDEEGRYYFLPHDADLIRPQETMLESRELKARIDRMMGRVLLFIDACNSGGVFGLERGSGALVRADLSGANILKSSLSDMLGVVVFAASRANEAAQEKRSLRNGVFTRALVEGLQGEADLQRQGLITVSQLEAYVGDRVRHLTQGTQHPATAKLGTLPDYPVAQVHVPLWRRRAFWPVLGGTLAAALVGAAITMGIVIKPDYDRGNTGWLAAP